MKVFLWLVGIFGAAASCAVIAAETTTFEYDAQGRLIQSTISGGPADGTTKITAYDQAGNRTNQTVTGVAPPLSFSVNNVSVSEGGNLVFTVTKTGSASGTYSLSYATANGTAGSSDYTANSGTLSFTTSQTTRTITVVTTEDNAVEGNETVFVNLSAPSGNATITDTQGTGTITNDDTPPSFAINNVSVSEGGNLVFTVTKTGSASGTYSLSYATANGTAGSSDYTANSGTLSFTTSQTTRTITVATTEDNAVEGNETVFVNLSAPTGGATISDTQGQGTINNDDTPPSFAINNRSVSEGGNLVFTVTKTGSASGTYSLSYATANGTAGSSDYTANSGTLSFTTSQTSKTITVSSIEDSIYEGSEVFYVDLSGATGGATISDSRGNGTITNDDAAPSFSVNNASANEGSSMTFTITRTGTDGASHSVSWATANNSATAGSDYSAASGTLRFSAAQTSRTFTVSALNDSSYENNENFYVNLSNATGVATISDGQGVGTVIDTDSTPSFSINNVSVTEGGNLIFTITKTGLTSQTFSVSYATANGTAGSSDYTSNSGVATFTASQSSKQVVVQTTDDSADESNETVRVNLSSATNGATISDSQGTGTIIDDDLPANNAPVANTDYVGTIPICTFQTFDVVANDTDPDGDYPLTVISATGGLSPVVIGTTSIRVTSTTATGNFPITYTIQDSRGATDNGIMSVNVSGGFCF